MKRVVERCPTCGVEHDHVADGCEVCGTALRYWCRTHSREIGWLDGEDCPRCPPVVGRATTPRPPVAAPPPAPTPPPPAPRATSPAGWRRRTMAAPPPAVPVAAPPPPTPVVVSPVPAPAAEPAEPADEAENRAAKEVRRPGLFQVAFEGVLTMLQTGITGTLLGMGAGGFYAYYLGADIPATAMQWGVYGAILGMVPGGMVAGLLLMAWSRSKRGP